MKKINKITGIDFLTKDEFKNNFIIVKSAEVDDVYSYQHEDGSIWKHAVVTLWFKNTHQVKRLKMYLDVKKADNHITAAELYRIACNSNNPLMIPDKITYNDYMKAIANGIMAISNGIEDVLDCNFTLLKAA